MSTEEKGRLTAHIDKNKTKIMHFKLLMGNKKGTIKRKERI